MTDDATSTTFLTCYLQSTRDNEKHRETLILEKVKGKSSFVLTSPQIGANNTNDSASEQGNTEYYSIPKPSCFVFEDVHPNNSKISSHFFFGGFQIIANAKKFNIYLTSDKGKDEEFLMTCRGIPYTKEGGTQKWFRALCVVPGGPRSISKLKIEPVDSSNSEDDMILYVKLTARLTAPQSIMITPPVTTVSDTSSRKVISPCSTLEDNKNSKQRLDQKVSSNNDPPVTQSDLGATMAGLSFMAREIEKNTVESLKEHSNKLETNMESYFSKLELGLRGLTSTLIAQHQVINENQTMIQEQERQIQKLLNNGLDLKVRVQSLQAEISILRHNLPIVAGKNQLSNSVHDHDDNYVDIGDNDDYHHDEKEDHYIDVDDHNHYETTDSPSFSQDEEDVKIENDRVAKAKSKGADHIAGCFPVTSEIIKEPQDPADIHKATKTTLRESDDKSFFRCGPIIADTEEQIMKNIDAMFLPSHASENFKCSEILKNSSSMENVGNNDKEYNYTANVEVALIEKEPLLDKLCTLDLKNEKDV